MEQKAASGYSVDAGGFFPKVWSSSQACGTEQEAQCIMTQRPRKIISSIEDCSLMLPQSG